MELERAKKAAEEAAASAAAERAALAKGLQDTDAEMEKLKAELAQALARRLAPLRAAFLRSAALRLRLPAGSVRPG